jgi:hypothetical protein
LEKKHLKQCPPIDIAVGGDLSRLPRRRYGDLDDMREVPLNGYPACAAFIATHRVIFYFSPALVKPMARACRGLGNSLSGLLEARSDPSRGPPTAVLRLRPPN